MTLNDKFDNFLDKFYIMVCQRIADKMTRESYKSESELLIADFHEELTKYQPKPNTLNHPWKKQIYAEVNKKK